MGVYVKLLSCCFLSCKFWVLGVVFVNLFCCGVFVPQSARVPYDRPWSVWISLYFLAAVIVTLIPCTQARIFVVQLCRHWPRQFAKLKNAAVPLLLFWLHAVLSRKFVVRGQFANLCFVRNSQQLSVLDTLVVICVSENVFVGCAEQSESRSLV